MWEGINIVLFGITITLSAAARLAPSCCACQAFLQLPGQEFACPSF